MSHSGLTVQYYDAEDQALLRMRANREQRAHGHAHSHAPTPVAVAPPAVEAPVFQERSAPPPGYVQALLGNDAPPYDPSRDALSRGVDVTRQAEQLNAASVGGVPGATCDGAPARPSVPAQNDERSSRAAMELDIMSLDIREVAQWLMMAYLPTRFGIWLGERRASRQDGGG